MQNKHSSVYVHRLAWAGALAATAYALVRLIRQPPADDGIVLLLGLLAATAGAAHLASRRSRRGLPRLALTFVLTSLVLLPAPATLLLVVVASVVGRGGGIAGIPRGSGAATAALALAVGLAETLGATARSHSGPALHFVWILASLVVIQLGSLALTGVLPGERATLRWRAEMWRNLALETVSAPLAWLLAGLLESAAWTQAAALALLVLAAQWALLQLSRASGALTSSRRALASRISELDTLHAIGREILASLEPSRVCTVIDRECRKIFDVEACLIALADSRSGTLRVVYRRRRGLPAETDESPLDANLARWALESKQGFRADDPERRGVPSAEPGMRSTLVAPLIVEDRVLGVVSIQTSTPEAYDDHQLSVLTTIAHQAAIAIENARHYQLATVDSLTGCFLRDYFFKRLGEEHDRFARYGGTFSLLMIDIDGFKQINDKHGHLAGDRYLREIAAIILAQLRAADIACRYGGDEFSLLLPETDLAGAQVIAERIRSAVADSAIAHEEAHLRGTVSIGVAVYPQHGSGDIHGLLRNADEALYRAKRSGRDCVVPFAA